MNRRHLFVIVGLAAALGLGGDALAGRLYGNYRGPEDAKASDTSQNETAEPTTSDDEQTGPSAGASDEGGGGIGETGDGGSDDDGGAGAPDGGDDGGGDSGDSGGSDIGGGGGESTGAGAGTADTGSSGGSIGGGGGGGGGGLGPGRGKSASATERFELVSWFFEHNREKFLFDVAGEQNRRLRIPKGTAAAVFSVTPQDERIRTPVSAEDRDRIFDILKSATIDKQSVVRDAAVIALGKLGTEQAVDVLLERARLESNMAVKQDSILALGLSRSPKALDTLIAALRDRNLNEYALLGLGLSGDLERGAPAVLEFFETGKKRKASEESMACAAIALGVLRYEAAVEPLVDALKNRHTARPVQVYACQALGQIGGEDAEKALIKAMDAKDAQTKRAAALSLGYIPTSSALKAVSGKAGLRGNSDPLMAGFASVSAASILAEMPPSEWKKVPDEIREIAQSPNKSKIKAQYANVALAVMGGVDGDIRRYYTEELAGASTDADTLSAMAMAAGVAAESSVAPLLEDIAKSVSRDPKLQSYAALSLGLLGGGPDRARLLRQIYKVDRADVRRGAVAALGLVGDRRDVPFLISVITDTKDKWLGRFTRGAAVASIGMIGDSQSVPKLQQLLGNSDADTRAFAVSALGYLADKDPRPQLPTLFARNNFRVEFESLKAVMGQL